MAEPRLQDEILGTKAENQPLRESISSMSVGWPIVHKDLSLVTLVPKWSGSDASVTLEELLSSIESAAKIGHWSDQDKREIAVLELTNSAQLFYQGCTELHAEGTTWQSFEDAFRRRYENVHKDQYHFTKLQTARQKNGESPQEFADRCRGLDQKILCMTGDPVAQRIHRENAERVLLASFVSDLVGTRVLRCDIALFNPFRKR
jgi:hypothetical protein